MHIEILFIALLIAPWALVLVAVLFYRQWRICKTLNNSEVVGMAAMQGFDKA
jgi:hypothetical protein